MGPVTWAAVGRFALRHWYVAPIAGLLAYALILDGRVGSRDLRISQLETSWVQLEARNSTTQASLDGALGKIFQLNEDAKAAAKRFEDDRTSWAATNAALSERYRSTSDRVRALENSAKAIPLEPCKPSGLALDALKEL